MNIRSFYFKFILILAIVFFSCTNNSTNVAEKFEKEIYTPAYSTNFRIDGNENSEDVLISVFNPWQGASDVVSSVVVKRDSISPINAGVETIDGKIERIVCMSSTHIAMLEAIDAVDLIVGVSGKEYISNEKIIEKNVPDIGYEGNIDYEMLIASQPDIVLLFSVNGSSTMEPKLKELGIPFIYIGDYVEENPLGKAEWLVVLAELTGQREKGIEKFKDIENNYNKLKSLVAASVENTPKVMVNAPFMNSWFMPSSQSYIAGIIKDAGAEMTYDKNTGNTSVPIEEEEALKLVDESDYWINIGNINSLDELKNLFPKFVNTRCVRKGNLYNNNRRQSPGGGNDCYESGVVNPDLILRDLIKIFHPQLVTDEFVYYHKLE